MAYQDMWAEVRGAVPKMPIGLARKLVNRAYNDICRQNLWSFQLYDRYQWISPALIQAGIANVVQGSDQVTVDATAAAAINAGNLTYSLITQRQFRIAAGTVYNIYGWNGTNTLTLDRPYGELTASSQTYQIYQVYYAAPYKDHLTFISVRDMQNFIDLTLTKTRAMLDEIDPQRSWYTFPTDAVFYENDPNPASPTFQYPMYELWGAPQYNLNYQLYGIRKGADLSANTDLLPVAIGEDCVIEYAKYYAYQWAEANKSSTPGDKGPDYKFLMGAAKADYSRLYKDYRRRDRETVNQWFFIRRIPWGAKWIPYYSVQSGTASPGAGFMW